MRKFILFLILLLAIAGTVQAGTLASFGSVPEGVTAISAVDNTTNYIGTNTGKIYVQTISDGSISATLECTVPHAISTLHYDAVAATIYVGTGSGLIYKCTP